MEPKQPSGSFSASAMRGLTYAQHLPTPFITTFMLIHLAAPALASVGGTDTASQVMLLGREYYHGIPQEALLVYAPITLHVASSLAKRTIKIVRWVTKAKDATEMTASQPESSRSITATDVLQWTGYPLLFLLSPHISTHRLNPSTPSPAISSISPSELDFSFVHFGLQNWPIRSWAMYSILVGAGLFHVTYGVLIVWRQTMLRLLKKSGIVRSDSRVGLSWRAAPKAALVGISIILLGLFRISREDVFISRLTKTRMVASYRLSPLYR
ncbi:hypothetical protein BDV93DRAFT_463644 [Ceratobasidium sp. AG-I]|nr:hypothetical protein BDV93DRAFT_463644 [Ceratobasidium sp. AG-I]